MNAEAIKRFFDTYRATLAEVERLDVLIRTRHDWAAWKQALTNRTEYLHHEYSRMKTDIEQMLDAFRADTPDPDDAAWTQFRMSLRDCYTADAHDLAIINVAAQILLDHVEKHDPDNLEARMQAYLYLGYTNLEYSRIVREGFSEKSIEYYQKVADLWPRYGEIDSAIVHQAIVVSLINLEMTSVCLGTYPPEKGYPCWQAMKQIQASPAFERLREKEEGVANLLDLYVARYETDAFAVAVTPKKPFDPALREELIAMTERAYAEKVHPDHWTADMYQVLISQMTNYECWKIIHDFYMQTHATMNQEEIDVIS